MSDVASVKMVFRRTTTDYVRGVLLNLRHSPGSLAGLLVAPMMVAFLPPVVSGFYEGWWRIALEYSLLTLLGLIVIVVGASALNAWQVSRSIGATSTMTYTFNADGVGIESELGNASTNWLPYNGAFENKRFIVLRQQPNCAHILPTGAVDREELRRLRNLLRNHVKGPVRLLEVREL
ncbi:MAG: hypothetical protein JNL81_15215 [Hyphomonadaceae bacterium]|nr:hypothetical protein [Hyphomonadaceae bacterium]